MTEVPNPHNHPQFLFFRPKGAKREKSLSTVTFLGTLSWCYLSDKFRKCMGCTGKQEGQLAERRLGFFSSIIVFSLFCPLLEAKKL